MIIFFIEILNTESFKFEVLYEPYMAYTAQ